MLRVSHNILVISEDEVHLFCFTAVVTASHICIYAACSWIAVALLFQLVTAIFAFKLQGKPSSKSQEVTWTIRFYYHLMCLVVYFSSLKLAKVNWVSAKVAVVQKINGADCCCAFPPSYVTVTYPLET